MPIRLVVGLGNPGDPYLDTPHNAGFMVLERLAGEEASWRSWGGGGEFRSQEIGVRNCLLLKPLTFMNQSGRCVEDFARFHRVPASDVLVCLDDLSLPMARLRLRARGSSGGHRGLESVLERLGTEEVPRLRIGIGPLPPGRDAAEYVTGRLAEPDLARLRGALDRALSAVRDCVLSGVESAMNRHNAAGDDAS